MYRDSLRLNEAMLRNDPNDIDKILDRLTRARLSEKDKEKSIHKLITIIYPQRVIRNVLYGTRRFKRLKMIV